MLRTERLGIGARVIDLDAAGATSLLRDAGALLPSYLFKH